MSKKAHFQIGANEAHKRPAPTIIAVVQRIIQATTGMDNKANKVVRNVPCAMTVSSTPNLRQKIVPNEATGIAMMRVLMAMEVGSKST